MTTIQEEAATDPSEESQANPLEKYRIKSLPPNAYYIPNFISPTEEESLLEKITNTPTPRWTHLTHRRLLTYPSTLTTQNVLLSAPLPAYLIDPIIPRLASLQIFNSSPHTSPNHCLINEYTPGQGIMPHEDGSAYFPLVATVSLNSPLVLDIYPKPNGSSPPPPPKTPGYRILQERRSLLVMSGEMYTDHLHGIKEVKIDEELRGGQGGVCNWELLGDKGQFGEGWMERGMRVSLTFRDVKHVKKLGSAFKFMGGKR